jgi:hypothetical protein
MPVAAAAGAVVGAGLGIWSDSQKRKSEKAAYQAQRDAVRSLEGIDVRKAEQLIADKDMAHYTRTLGFFREQHPELAQARDTAMKELADTVEGAREFFSEQERLFKQQVAEAAPDPIIDEIRKELLEQTQANLRRGAELPPQFQAELVKAGLEGDVTGSRQGPLAQRLGRMIGSAGLEMEAMRRQEAGMALQFDQAIQAARQGILGNLVSQAAQIPAQQAAFFGTTQQGIDSMIPNIGLKGADVFALEEANRELENQRKMTLAGLKAQDYISMGNRDASMIGRGAQLASSLGGMMGGGMGGLFGGGGGMTGAVSSSQYGTVSAPPTAGSSAVINRTWLQQHRFDTDQRRYEGQ